MKLFLIAVLIGVLSVALSDAEEQCSEAQSQLGAMKSAFDVCTKIIKKTGEKQPSKATVSTNPCELQKKYCPNGGIHPQCNSNGSINQGKGKSLPFNTIQKNWITYKFNEYKNNTCSGAVLDYEKCDRNTYLSWDDGLAILVQASTEYCDFGKTFHACYATDTFHSVGRLVWPIKIDSKGITNEKWQELIDMLVEGYKRDDMSNIRIFNHTETSKGYTEGFTSMMGDGSTKFACGSTLCNGGVDWIVSCLFGPRSNFLGQSVYRSSPGSRPAAGGCITGKHATFSALCSEHENSFIAPYAFE